MKQIVPGFFLLIFLAGFGTVGYVIIEGWTMFDAFYMTIITISTTGFKELHPISETGRVLTTFLIIAGVGTIAYMGGRAVQAIVEYQVFRRRKLHRKVAELKNHYIVCGYGRLGKPICEELNERDTSFVVIERNEKIADILVEKGYLYIIGDATEDEVLLGAGIKRASGLVAVLATDADNVYVTLTAKVLKPDVFVVTRAIDDEAEKKLKRAGANRIVKPYEIGASRMAHLLTRPAVADFMDIVAREKGNSVDLNLEEILVEDSSSLLNKTLAETSLRQNLNIILVAIFRENGDFVYNPTSSAKLMAGDRLIAIGQEKDLAVLNKLCT